MLDTCLASRSGKGFFQHTWVSDMAFNARLPMFHDMPNRICNVLWPEKKAIFERILHDYARYLSWYIEYTLREYDGKELLSQQKPSPAVISTDDLELRKQQIKDKARDRGMLSVLRMGSHQRMGSPRTTDPPQHCWIFKDRTIRKFTIRRSTTFHPAEAEQITRGPAIISGTTLYFQCWLL